MTGMAETYWAYEITYILQVRGILIDYKKRHVLEKNISSRARKYHL